jgi:carboxypeptidase-like protein
MPKSLQIHIPEPCHENWQNMTPKEQGRFCGSCCKTVIDFSAMTDKEMLDYISKASHHVCGRFSNDQLNKDIKITANKKRFSFAYLLNLLLATLLVSEANAQVKPVKKKKPPVHKIKHAPITMGIIAVDEEPVTVKVLSIKVNGTVLDATTKLPLPGATIRIVETFDTILADTSGNFNVFLKNDAVTLEFSAIGYETQTRVLDKDSVPYMVFLKPVESTGGDAIVIADQLRGWVGGITVSYKETRVEKVKKAIKSCVPAALKKDVRIYPNPVVRGNDIRASIALKSTGEYKLELLDAAGNVVAVQPLIMQAKEQIVTVPTHVGWSAGVYWIRISAPGTKNVYQGKVLLQ